MSHLMRMPIGGAEAMEDPNNKKTTPYVWSSLLAPAFATPNLNQNVIPLVKERKCTWH